MAEEEEEFEDVQDEPYDDYDEADEIDEDDIDLDELDEDDIDLGEIEEEEVELDAPSGGRRISADDMTELDPEQVAKANPKRKSVRRKRRRVIEGILDTAEISTEEGAAKAWASLQKQAGGAKVRKYAVSEEYTENDVLEHPKFGEGYVVEILSGTKISVLFEDGLRRLAYNRG